jgi:hypothetical protein
VVHAAYGIYIHETWNVQELERLLRANVGPAFANARELQLRGRPIVSGCMLNMLVEVTFSMF